FGRPGSLRIDSPVLWALAFFSWGALSSLWSKDSVAMSVVLTQIALAIIFIATRDFIRTQSDLRTVAAGFLCGAIFAVSRLLVEIQLLGNTDSRTTTVFGDLNVNYVAYVLAAAFPVIVLLWSTSPPG